MKQYIKHFTTITRHKYYVGIECFKRGLYWQGIVHDLSKYSPIEFFSSAKYFQGNSSPVDAEKRAIGYSKAWLHHKGHNKHHWHYWVDWEAGKQVLCDIPKKYLDEMVCDFIGASKAYNKGKYTNDMPFNFYKQHSHEFYMSDNSRKYFVSELKGLELQS